MESVGLGSLYFSVSEIEKRTPDTLREEHWVTTLESMVLKKTLGPRKGEEREGYKKHV